MRWVETREGQPVSALSTSHVLFVVLVDSNYMRVDSTSSRMQLPPDQGTVSTVLTIRLPAKHKIVEGYDFDRRSLAVRDCAKGYEVNCRFRGPGTILTFKLRQDDSIEPVSH